MIAYRSKTADPLDVSAMSIGTVIEEAAPSGVTVGADIAPKCK